MEASPEDRAIAHAATAHDDEIDDFADFPAPVPVAVEEHAISHATRADDFEDFEEAPVHHAV